MIIPKKLYIKDFLSFEEEEIVFDNNITTCVMGRNLSDKGSLSNGSGKSGLQSAIELSYTGSVSRKVTKNKLVRRGCKQAVIIHHAYNSITGETLVIERTISIKEPEKINISLLKGSEAVLVKKSSVAEYNSWLVDYIGISKEDISNYFLPNELNYTSFFNSSDTKKKDLISRFSNANIVDSVFGVVSDKDSEIGIEISGIDRELLILETRIDTYEGELEVERSIDFEVEKSTKIEKIKGSIKSLEEDNIHINSNIKHIHSEISDLRDSLLPQKEKVLKSYQSLLDGFKGREFLSKISKKRESVKTLRDRIQECKNVEDEINGDLRAVSNDISKMNSIIEGGVTCPKCSYKFNPGENITIEDAENEIKVFNTELVDFSNDLKKIKEIQNKLANERLGIESDISELETLDEKQRKEKQKIKTDLEKCNDELFSLNSSVKKLSRDLSAHSENIEHNKTLITQYEKNIKTIIASEKDDTREKEIVSKIESLSKEILEVNKKMDEAIERKENNLRWGEVFKNFKSFLVNKKLKVIQDIINKFLEQIDSELRLKLEGYKTLRDGSVREQITPYIYDNGDICDYGEFSKGERARIDLATLLTYQTLVNENCDKGGLDLLFPDEIIEGVDSLGLSNLLNSLNKTEKTALLTTHVINENFYPHILMVEKVNKVSRIVKK